MAARKAISNKLRFEIFKRDSFTCQYCGNKAPDVVLNVDHIVAIKNGGDNDLLNLITSCFECNNGKRAKKLSDNTAIKKQQKQLEALNDKRNQLKLMVDWKNELKTIEQNKLNEIKNELEKNIVPYSISENFKKEVSKWIKKHEISDIFNAIEKSASQYLRYDTAESVCGESAKTFLNKISGILYFQSLPPLEQKIQWIKTMLGKYSQKQVWDVEPIIKHYCCTLKSKGWSEERIMEDLSKDVKDIIYSVNSYSSKTVFIETLERWTEQVKSW